jgi:hypothetical protein
MTFWGDISCLGLVLELLSAYIFSGSIIYQNFYLLYFPSLRKCDQNKRSFLYPKGIKKGRLFRSGGEWWEIMLMGKK